MKCDICYSESTNFVLNTKTHYVTGLCKIHYDMNTGWIKLRDRKEISKEEYEVTVVFES